MSKSPADIEYLLTETIARFKDSFGEELSPDAIKEHLKERLKTAKEGFLNAYLGGLRGGEYLIAQEVLSGISDGKKGEHDEKRIPSEPGPQSVLASSSLTGFTPKAESQPKAKPGRPKKRVMEVQELR